MLNQPEAILVTGARAPVALDLARAFAAASCEIWLGDSVPAASVRWSKIMRRGVGRFVHLPSARHHRLEYAEALHRWVKEHPSGLIVPTCEEVFHIAAAAEDLGFADQVFAPPPATLRRLHSKLEFPRWAATLGLDAPHTYEVDTRNLSALDLDNVVLKPEFSRFGTETFIRPTRRDLDRIRTTRRWVAQEFAAGEEISLWAAAREGRVVASVAYRPVWRLGRSAAFAFEAINVPAANKIAESIAADAHLTGQISFDIILTPDGRAMPIECNPRTVSGVHLFAPDLARAFNGDGTDLRPTSGVVHLGPAMILMGLPEAVRRSRLRQWFDDWRHGTDAIGRGSDPGAVAGSLADIAYFTLTGALHGYSPTRQTTYDIEWNGEPL